MSIFGWSLYSSLLSFLTILSSALCCVFNYLPIKLKLLVLAHSVPHLRSERSHTDCEKFSTIIIIIPSERYAPQSWLCSGTLALRVWHSKLKANQTDIALNTVFIFSPYLEMFTSSRWLTEVGRGDVSHFSCIRLSRVESSPLSESHSVQRAVFCASVI